MIQKLFDRQSEDTQVEQDGKRVNINIEYVYTNKYNVRTCSTK
jgi:hypothetical protein